MESQNIMLMSIDIRNAFLSNEILSSTFSNDSGIYL